MSIIPSSQLVLSRSRRDITKAVDEGDWLLVSALDKQLGDDLNLAHTDSQRDPAVLLAELSQLLSLYKKIMTRCDTQARELQSRVATGISAD